LTRELEDGVSDEPNRYVLRRKAGHPGYANAVVLSTSTDIRNLGKELARHDDLGLPLQHRATWEHQPKLRAALVFQAVSEEELFRLQRANWRFHIVRRVFRVVVTALALIGAYSLFH
jgi:hypothetical protein